VTVVPADGQFLVRRQFQRSCASAEDAERLDRLMAEAQARTLDRFEAGARACITIREGMDRFLEERSLFFGLAKSTLAGYRRCLTRFAEGLGDLPLDRISREMLQGWVRMRAAQKGRSRIHNPDAQVSRDTVNLELKALRCFARWAIDQGCAPADLPLLRVPLLRVKGLTRGRRHVPKALVRHSFVDVLRALDRGGYDYLALVLRGMVLFGLREAALFRIRWGDVALPRQDSAGGVRIPPCKGGPAGAVPVPADSTRARWLGHARRVWRRFRGRAPKRGDFVLTSRWGKGKRNPGGWTTDSFGHALGHACARLGIEGMNAYMARHSAVTWLQQQPHVDLAAVQAYARHLRITTQEVYSHRSGADGEPAYDAMDRLMTEAVPDPKRAEKRPSRGVTEEAWSEDGVPQLEFIDLAAL